MGRESGETRIATCKLWCCPNISLNMATSFGCSLCQDILLNDHRKRNKLHGSSCVVIKRILAMLSSEI